MVYTDAHTLNPGDLSWAKLEALGDLKLYEYSEAEGLEKRVQDAEVLLVNKTPITADLLSKLPALRCICVTATGYNNVDLAAAKERGIPVCNAVGYSTPAVVQHVFALLFAMTNGVERHNQWVKAGDWANQVHFAFWLQPLVELQGKTLGIYGFGRIGQALAQVALAFGMKVIANHKHPERDARPGLRFVDLDTLFEESDVVSLHAPLSAANLEIVNKTLLGKMKKTAYLINTGRGGLIHEQDLYDCLKAQGIAGAALDVLNQEPPVANHPLLNLDNCWVTPHHAWASQEARQRLMDITVENVKQFLEGKPQNVVNGL